MLQCGNLIEAGEPSALTKQLIGKVWWMPESDDMLIRYPDATRMLLNGEAGLRIISESDLSSVGIRVEPSLEDLYQYHFQEASQ